MSAEYISTKKLASSQLKEIDVFVAVTDQGSFTGAAEVLNLTNSAVGKGIARLESRLGVKLFDRTTRKLSPTTAGIAFHKTCMRILQELEETAQSLKVEGTLPAGRLRLDLPTTFGEKIVMPRVFDFLALFPQVKPQISFTDRLVNLNQEDIDLCVRLGGSGIWPEGLKHRFLGHEQCVFCCAPSYLQKHGELEDNREALRDVDAVLYRHNDGGPSPWLIDVGQGPAERFYPETRLEVGSAQSHVDALVHGLGVSQISTWLIDSHIRSGELVEVLPSLRCQGLPVYLAWRISRQEAPAVDAMNSYLTNNLRF